MTPRVVRGPPHPSACPRCGKPSAFEPRQVIASTTWQELRANTARIVDRPYDAAVIRSTLAALVVLIARVCARLVTLCEDCSTWLTDEAAKGVDGVSALPGSG